MNKLALILYGYLVPALWTTLLCLSFVGTGYKNFDFFTWMLYGIFSFMAYYLPYLVHTIYYNRNKLKCLNSKSTAMNSGHLPILNNNSSCFFDTLESDIIYLKDSADVISDKLERMLENDKKE